MEDGHPGLQLPLPVYGKMPRDFTYQLIAVVEWQQENVHVQIQFLR